MFHARHLRWADVDPATHPFDAASVEAALAAALGGARAKDHRRQEAHASAVLVRTVGLWTVGWAWSQSDGGPAIDRAREALIPDVMRALQSWRDYIEEMAAVFATLPREDDLVTALQRAAARVLPLVVARTDANDAWYATLSSALSWYVDHAQLATDDLHTAIADATRYEFSSWIAPEDDVATTAIDNVARRVVAPPASRDALEAWLVARANAFQYLT
ncbi:MAG TPA: hypothetical protein VK427_26950, partial [Kofleriaceae bacterium]|nr:hypothetical protein [Kofleriaceae bacterium]